MLRLSKRDQEALKKTMLASAICYLISIAVIIILVERVPKEPHKDITTVQVTPR